MDFNNRMKPLDVTKVLMGIRSTRENVKRFEQDGVVWAKRQDYDYNDILKVCENVVGQYYEDLLPATASALYTCKRLKE
jgi:TolB-like protein